MLERIAFALLASALVMPTASLAASSGTGRPDPVVAPITAFHVVSPGLYRGARPDRAGLEALVKYEVRTDLDLEDDSAAIAQEEGDAHDLGIRMISRPMSGFWYPNDAEVKDILEILADSRNYPIFVHCQHGEDRTGLIIALHRVFNERWTPAKAHHEMLELGFHPILFLLNHYFEEATGFED